MRPPYYEPRPADLPTNVPLHPSARLDALDDAKIFAAPDDSSDWPVWRAQLTRWRDEARRRIQYTDTRYQYVEQPCFVIGMANLWDMLLFDRHRGMFTPDRFVDYANSAFGGFDGIILWSAYPVIGIDDRSQFDYYLQVRELPRVIARIQARGVSVHLPFNPWATSQQSRVAAELASCVRELGVDGVFLDTARQGSPEIRRALDAVSPRLVMGGESTVPLARIDDHQMSWAQWFADSNVPGVLRAKWFERKHLQHQTRRWHRSHREELHTAWLNGSGMLVWENVFGVWVGWNAADRSMLKSMRQVHRRWSAWLLEGAWTPLADYPGSDSRVYASRWDRGDTTLWTIANLGDAATCDWLHVTDPDSRTWIELTANRKLTVERRNDGLVAVGVVLERGAIAAVLATPKNFDRGHDAHASISLRKRKEQGNGPLGGASTTAFPARIPARRQIPWRPVDRMPAHMVRVGGGRFDLHVQYRLRETGLYGEAPFVDEWKPPPGHHLHSVATIVRSVEISNFGIEEQEVSNRAFLRFLNATDYRPLHPGRFLEHWRNGRPPSEALDAPVVNVELEDARAYAEWCGWRIPSEDEWQVAAELGMIRRRQPLVWNLTESEHEDGRSAFVIVKGGGAHENDTSEWYFDGGPKPADFSAKLLLLAAGMSRSPSIGFRCAVDLGGPRSRLA